MAHVAALYRYPIKGFTPESVESLTVQPDGRIQGDRVLAFRPADAPPPPRLIDGAPWWPKRDLLSLMEYPGIARLRLRYDDASGTVSLHLDGRLLVEAALDEEGRDALGRAVGEYARDLPEAARLREAGALPLVLEGDGVNARFQDRPEGYVSLHGRGSLSALAEALDAPDLDEARFRSNIALEGAAPWAELDWTGRLRIGDVEFEVQRPVVRCLAVHANPATGDRDAQVLTTLTRTFGHEQPSFGILLLPTQGGGVVRVGDPLELVEVG